MLALPRVHVKPAGHASHLAEPALVCNWPSGHALQLATLVARDKLWNVPAGHPKHSVSATLPLPV